MKAVRAEKVIYTSWRRSEHKDHISFTLQEIQIHAHKDSYIHLSYPLAIIVWAAKKNQKRWYLSNGNGTVMKFKSMIQGMEWVDVVVALTGDYQKVLNMKPPTLYPNVMASKGEKKARFK